MKCPIIHDHRDPAGVCACSDIVKALRLSVTDVEKLKNLTLAIKVISSNRVANRGGLSLEESSTYLSLLDRILAINGALP